MTGNQTGLRILSINARGLRDWQRRKGFMQYVREKSDIAFIQEAHCTEEDIIAWNNQWGSGGVFSPGTSRSCGCLILYNQSKFTAVREEITDVNGRMAGLIVGENDEQILFMNIYAPNDPTQNEKFMRQLYHRLQELEEKHGYFELCLAGDWNFVECISLDRDGGNQTEAVFHKSREIMQGIKEQFDLIDSYRFLHPQRRVFT